MSDLTDSGRYNFMLSYTLWIAREEGLAVRYGASSGVGVFRSDSIVTYPQVDPKSGFKVGATYILDYDSWELSCSYTWFYNGDNSYIEATTSSTRTNFSFATWSLGATTVFAVDNQGNVWNNSFNRIDAILRGPCYIGDYISLRPFLGMVFAWDEQTFRASYGCPPFSEPENVVVEWNNDLHWYGIGPYLGISPSYIIWMCKDSCNSHSLSIFGKAGISLAWSRSNSKMKQFIGDMAPREKAIPTNTYRDIVYHISPMIDSSLGVSWNGRYDRWTSMASISWDIEAWFSHNHMFDISRYYSRRGVYSMQGFTLTGGFGF